MSALSERQFRNTLLGAFILLSWTTLWAWSRTPYGQHLHHAAAGTLPTLFFAIGWTLMTVAMMLPTSFPLLTLFHTMLGDRANRTWLIGLCISGYLITWVAFGVLANLGVLQLQSFVASANSQSVLLLVAGIYQFTPLKHYCLKKCRTPLSFILSHWHGRNEAKESLWLGAHHGLFCVGCCWPLMLLMFVAVAVHFLWMLGLGTVMAIEKNVAWGNRISSPVGIILILAAVMLQVVQ